MGTLVYITLFASYLFHWSSYLHFKDGLFKGEVSDFWFCLIFLTSGFLAREPEFLEYFKKSYFISLGILLTSGLVSIFTPFRLAPFVMNGFKLQEGERLQHFAGQFLGINTYLPIGFMNTHLTFGGLLGLFFPGLLAYYIYKFPDRKDIKNIFYSFIIFLFSVVLFYNQSRSVWLGLIFAMVVMINKWKNFLKEFINKERLIYITLLLSFITATGIFFIQRNWLMKRAITESVITKTTENQRYFIFRNTLEIIYDNFFLGVGPGNFYKKHNEKSEKMVRENQELWYELYITPRGHAHNDFLHLFAIGGILTFICYFFFWFLNIRFFLESEDERDSVLFSGFLVFFPAGFFQCYFLDDEVALPFFVFLGIFCGRIISLTEVQKEKEKILNLLRLRKSRAGAVFQVEALSIKNALDALSIYFQKSTATNTQINKTNSIRETLLILCIPLSIIFSYIFWISSKNPSELFYRVVKSDSTEMRDAAQNALDGRPSSINTHDGTTPFKIDGCLTHTLSDKPVIRKVPYKIGFKIFDWMKSPPKKVKIGILSRDTFDQDKLYRVHAENLIFEKEYDLQMGENNFEFSEILSSVESEKFPDNVFFRDFQISFTPGEPPTEKMDIPPINLSRLCD